MQREYLVETEEYQKRQYKVLAKSEEEALSSVYSKSHRAEVIQATKREIRFAHVIAEKEKKVR